MKVPLGKIPKCALCSITFSVMWRKNDQGQIVCNSCSMRPPASHARRGNCPFNFRKSTRAKSARKNARNQNCFKSRGRRSMAKKTPIKKPVKVFPVPITLSNIFHRGDYFQVGDIVSPIGTGTLKYFAQIHGLAIGEFGEKCAYLSWLYPTTASNKSIFDAGTYYIGMIDDEPRNVKFLKLVSHAPAEFYKIENSPYKPEGFDYDTGFIWDTIKESLSTLSGPPKKKKKKKKKYLKRCLKKHLKKHLKKNLKKDIKKQLEKHIEKHLEKHIKKHLKKKMKNVPSRRRSATSITTTVAHHTTPSVVSCSLPSAVACPVLSTTAPPTKPSTTDKCIMSFSSAQPVSSTAVIHTSSIAKPHPTSLTFKVPKIVPSTIHRSRSPAVACTTPKIQYTVSSSTSVPCTRSTRPRSVVPYTSNSTSSTYIAPLVKRSAVHHATSHTFAVPRVQSSTSIRPCGPSRTSFVSHAPVRSSTMPHTAFHTSTVRRTSSVVSTTHTFAKPHPRTVIPCILSPTILHSVSSTPILPCNAPTTPVSYIQSYTSTTCSRQPSVISVHHTPSHITSVPHSASSISAVAVPTSTFSVPYTSSPNSAAHQSQSSTSGTHRTLCPRFVIPLAPSPSFAVPKSKPISRTYAFPRIQSSTSTVARTLSPSTSGHTVSSTKKSVACIASKFAIPRTPISFSGHAHSQPFTFAVPRTVSAIAVSRASSIAPPLTPSASSITAVSRLCTTVSRPCATVSRPTYSRRNMRVISSEFVPVRYAEATAVACGAKSSGTVSCTESSNITTVTKHSSKSGVINPRDFTVAKKSSASTDSTRQSTSAANSGRCSATTSNKRSDKAN